MIWFYRFHCQAQDFSNQLYLILKKREHGCSIHESHVQALFEAFACMFGLKSGLSSVPCLEIETKRIMKLEISGAADIIFPYKMFSPFQEVKQGTQHPSVVAVNDFYLYVFEIQNILPWPKKKIFGQKRQSKTKPKLFTTEQQNPYKNKNQF